MNIDYESLATAARIIRSVRAETFEGFLDSQDPSQSYLYGRATASCEVAYTTIRELLSICLMADPDDPRPHKAIDTLNETPDRPSLTRRAPTVCEDLRVYADEARQEAAELDSKP